MPRPPRYRLIEPLAAAPEHSRPAPKVRSRQPAAQQWRQNTRPHVLRSCVVATSTLSWTPVLMKVLMEELHVDGSIEELLDVPIRSLNERRYAQAVAIALILRHSWRADDLARILKRLRLKVGRLP